MRGGLLFRTAGFGQVRSFSYRYGKWRALRPATGEFYLPERKEYALPETGSQPKRSGGFSGGTTDRGIRVLVEKTYLCRAAAHVRRPTDDEGELETRYDDLSVAGRVGGVRR